MQIRIPELYHYARYLFDVRILGKRRPLVGGINITSHCNLACLHCPYAAGLVPPEHLSRSQVESMMQTFLDRGVRLLFLQGGEPTLWRDGEYRFDDLVRDAKKKFFRVACVTNGILPIDNSCDLVWISVDGSPQTHDLVRGEGSYAKTQANVAASSHPNIYANVTLSRLNADDLETCIEHIARDMPNVKGISINFQIPYPEVEKYTLSYPQRAEVVERIVALKRKKYPILNSAPAMRLMLHPGWNTTHWLIALGHPQGAIVEGCGARMVDPEICKMCGYGVMAEVQAVWRGNPAAIWAALRLFRIAAM
ncbi:MAG: radical SAM protein [Chloroflexota bacterium]|nr:radical SAM protein [Chloroflexota bacterium]